MIKALSGGELPSVDNALAGRAPIISITAAKEYLQKGDVATLRRFLRDRGGRIGDAASGQQIDNLVAQAKILGSRFGKLKNRNDVIVGASAAANGVPLLTQDAKLVRFFDAVGVAVEHWSGGG